jgi:hypothetical protein
VALLEKVAASLVSLLEDKRLAEISGDELREVPLGDEVHKEVSCHLLPLVLLHHSLHQLFNKRARYPPSSLLQLRSVPGGQASIKIKNGKGFLNLIMRRSVFDFTGLN